MRASAPEPSIGSLSYFVDGALFGRREPGGMCGPEVRRMFGLGMAVCPCEADVVWELQALRASLESDPRYATIWSLKPQASQKERAFDAADDPPEIRTRVFELLITLRFSFRYSVGDAYDARRRNRREAGFRQRRKELCAWMVRKLFPDGVAKASHYRFVVARRGRPAHTEMLMEQLRQCWQRLVEYGKAPRDATVEIVAAYPWEEPCLQVANYSLWTIRRLAENGERRFMDALGMAWHMGPLPRGTRIPAEEQQKSRWI